MRQKLNNSITVFRVRLLLKPPRVQYQFRGNNRNGIFQKSNFAHCVHRRNPRRPNFLKYYNIIYIRYIRENRYRRVPPPPILLLRRRFQYDSVVRLRGISVTKRQKKNNVVQLKPRINRNAIILMYRKQIVRRKQLSVSARIANFLTSSPAANRLEIKKKKKLKLNRNTYLLYCCVYTHTRAINT